jgi:nucleotide-binding universal stress UspA family protein
MYKHILIAMDGSEPSRFAAQAAANLAIAIDARITVCHIYGVEIHRHRFSEMEPGLPANYQEQKTLSNLRTAHGKLIQEGFRALSTGYVEDFVASSRDAGINIDSIAIEGRSYVGILQIAEKYRIDLISLGADGLGAIDNGMLGGTTTRVLHNAMCDVLVARRAPTNGPILTGVDGSEQALNAVAKAIEFGRATKRPVHMIAAYDPDFHTKVFGVMTHSLSPQRQEEVGLAKQEKLHDDIINDGLGKLYKQFLNQAQQRFSDNGSVVKTFLTTGKAYCALDKQVRDSGADLIVISRHGHHHEYCSHLGSNAEGLLRTTSGNVLLVGGINEAVKSPKPVSHSVESSESPSKITWDSNAEARLQRVPSFVRIMAKRAVENAVRESGKNYVSADDFDSVATKFGMGIKGDNL